MSTPSRVLHLSRRRVLRLSGKDTKPFLQGLITNDINRLAPGRPLYAALLTPQGKYLFDFILYQDGEEVLLDCEAARLAELAQRLTFYKLRAAVEITDVSGALSVWVFSPPEHVETSQRPKKWIERSIHFDPRLKKLGGRAVLAAPPEGFEPWAAEDYKDLRLSLGVPDSGRDLEADKRFILEANLDRLNGVDFKKGCYVGQEMTARMNYRGTIKKRLLPAEIEGPLPTPGTNFFGDGHKAGHILSGQGRRAMTLTRLEFLEKVPFETKNGAKIAPFVPGWLKPKSD